MFLRKTVLFLLVITGLLILSFNASAVTWDVDQDGKHSLPDAINLLRSIAGITPDDADGDGFTVDEGDCDDHNGAIYPGADEIAEDGVDSNCDGFDSSILNGDYTLFQGVWCGERKGIQYAWTFSDGGFDMKGSGGESAKGTFSINENTSPKEIDVVFTEIFLLSAQPGTARGIYKFENNELYICIENPGNTRRAEIFSEQDAALWILAKENCEHKPNFQDYVGTWEGEADFLAVDGEAWNEQISITISRTPTGLTGVMMGDTILNGTVQNGIFVFSVPNSDPSDPDCQNWDVSGTGVLGETLMQMDLILEGVFCGRTGGKQGKFEGNLLKTDE